MGKQSTSLGWKLVLSLVGSLVVLLGVISFITFNQHQDHLRAAVISGAMRIADTIEQTITRDMLRSNCLEAFELIHTIGTSNDIEKIRIFDKEGHIEYSTNKGELDNFVDKDAEQCFVCHSSSRPARRLETDQRWRIFRDTEGKRILGLINPIWNEPRCSTADCHYHPTDISVLGVLDVNMSLDEVDTLLAGDRNLTLLMYVFMVAVVALISGVFVMFMVHRPVKALIEGTQVIASGHLNHKLKIERQDELGLLADSFNSMTVDLKRAQDEIREWARTLEQRVHEKTEELERAHKQIFHVEKMASLGKLSAVVAHEINNPLTGVLTYAKLLHRKIEHKKQEIEEGAPPDFSDCAGYVEVIEHETARCGDIVKNLLMFSKRNTVHFEENDLNDLLNKSVKLVHHQIELAHIELKENLDKNLPRAFCDAGQVQQIFVALLTNAVEAIGQDGKIELKTFYDFVNKKIVFQISDDGPGMDDDTRQHIFEPFYTTKEGTNGSGLGLAVVYSIVERHGARIHVDSAPNKGATFTIRFPLQPPVGAEKMDMPAGAPPDRI